MSYYSIPAIVIEYIEYMYQLNQFADWLQRHTKTDIRYLAKGGFWVSLAHGIQLLGGALITVVLANTLAKEDLGIYQFVLSTATILTAFTLTGLATSIATATAKGDDGALRTGVRTKMQWNLGIILAAAAVAGYYFYSGNSFLGTAFLIAGAFLPLTESFHLYQTYLIGKQDFRFNAYLNITRKLLPLIAILGTLAFTRDPLHLIFVYFASHAITMFILYKLTIRKYHPPLSNDFADTLHFSKHLSAMAVADRVAAHIDKVLVFHHLGSVAVATYTIAQLPTKYTGSTLSLIGPLVLPKLAKRDFTTLQVTLPRKVRLLFVVAALVTALYILLAPWLFALVFPSYPEAVLISQALALSIMLIPRSTYGQALIAHNKTKSLYILNTSMPALKLTLLYVLLPMYGIWGAVYAILASDSIGALLGYTFFKRTR